MINQSMNELTTPVGNFLLKEIKFFFLINIDITWAIDMDNDQDVLLPGY